jgi:multidrug resistance efflux pump
MSAISERRATSGTVAVPGRILGSRLLIPWSRIAKLAGASAVLALGAYAVIADQMAIATDNAVVSAYSIALRAPIDGVIEAAPRRVGDPVSADVLLATINNTLVDDQRLVDLREQLSQSRSRLEANAVMRASLAAMRLDLQARSEAYMKASAARLQGAVTEAQNTLAAAKARRDEEQKVLARRSILAQGGAGSAADLEKAQSEFEATSAEAEAQQGRVDSLVAQLTAIDQGVVSEPGSNDVAYSRQRADEIAIRLAELDHESALTRADIEETSARLASEQKRVEKLRTAPMIAPKSGVIWKLAASNGERVAAGETVAQIVDCNSAFLIARVPQNQVPYIGVNDEAEFRLSGDDTKRHGHVLTITGDTTDGDRNLAAVPFVEKGATATVRIAMDPIDGQCLVGRTARVLIPWNGPGLFSRLLSWFV